MLTYIYRLICLYRVCRQTDMKHSDRSVSGAIIIFLLVITTYTYILLIVSNNRPLFAQIRVLVHGRANTRELIAVQNVQSGNISTNKTRGIQKNSLPTIIAKNMTALYPPINGSTQLRVAPENSANISSQFEKGVRIALVEPTFTARSIQQLLLRFLPKI